MHRLSCGFEVKFASDAEPGTFEGYGAVFGNEDVYGDVIAKGAFKDTLRSSKKSGNWPAMLSQHGGGFFGSAADMTPIGIWTSMEEDDVGLKVQGKFAETPRGQEAYALLKMEPRPALNGLSIGYLAKEYTIGTKPGEPARTLKKVELLEVSLVTFPANPEARVSAVKGVDDIRTIRDFEAFLREVGGFSHAAAKAIALSGFKAKSEPRDEDGGLNDLLASMKRASKVLT